MRATRPATSVSPEPGFPRTGEARRACRALIVTTAGPGERISGAIPHEETIRQHTKDGPPFAEALAGAGILPGAKVDTRRKGTWQVIPERR